MILLSSMSRLRTFTSFSEMSSELPQDRGAAFEARLSRVYAGAAFSPTLFASPLGPVKVDGSELVLPRFHYLTPKTSEESIRVVLHAGYDHRDFRSTEAVLHLLELLLVSPDLGDGMQLTLFPMVDVHGLRSGTVRSGLSRENWLGSAVPEIGLLAKDARQRGYQIFVELETSEDGVDDELVVASLKGSHASALGAYADAFLTSEEFAPFAVRFEMDRSPEQHGPLTIAEDLAYAPLLLRLQLPSSWTVELYREAAVRIARQLILRYRSHQSYGQHI